MSCCTIMVVACIPLMRGKRDEYHRTTTDFGKSLTLFYFCLFIVLFSCRLSHSIYKFKRA